jgi:hypothetical protein
VEEGGGRRGEALGGVGDAGGHVHATAGATAGAGKTRAFRVVAEKGILFLLISLLVGVCSVQRKEGDEARRKEGGRRAERQGWPAMERRRGRNGERRCAGGDEDDAEWWGRG